MSNRYALSNRHPRRGITVMFSLALLAVLLALVAFALDMGYVVLVRTQLQVAADSAAMSAAAVNLDGEFSEVVLAAQQFAQYHRAGGKQVQLNSSDVELGVWDFDTRTFQPSPTAGNAVRVAARRDESTNGGVRLFFARALGIASCDLEAQAVAAFAENFSGFRRPPENRNLMMLPFALDKQTWDDLREGETADDWTWDEELGIAVPGADGVREANLFPQATGAPGNRGTISLGNGDSSTSDVERQIVDGLAGYEVDFHGGTIELDESNQFLVTGDPGLSLGFADELAAVVGKPRIIPLFGSVDGSGSKAVYQIVAFAGVRLVHVDMSGSSIQVMVQPAEIEIVGGITSEPGTQTSYSIYSPVCLVQ